MAGKVLKAAAAAAASTGGSLISEAKLKQLYATMMQCRLLTERACRLRGQPAATGLYAASLGQEAIATGFVVDLLPDDTVVLAPHDSIAGLVKGVPLAEIASAMYARQRRIHRKPTPHNVIWASSSGSQMSVAIEAALANKRKRNGNVVVAFTGKAATTFEHWHQAIQLATSRSLAILFVAENNPWRDAAGVEAQHETEDFAHKAQVYGLPFIAVDGNDVVAVYRVAYESLERVRLGIGPVSIEGKTYRLESQANQRAAAKPAAGRSKSDPLIHMERYLKAKKLFTARAKNQLVQDFSRELDAALQAARKTAAKAPK